jgi:hypothetical protein
MPSMIFAGLGLRLDKQTQIPLKTVCKIDSKAEVVELADTPS